MKTKTLRIAATIAALTLVLTACGSANGSPAASGPDDPVSSTPGDEPTPQPSPSTIKGAQPVEPRPGMDGVHPIAWTRVRPTKDPHVVHVFFWSGVEPCYVLDHVTVKENSKRVTITLFQGHDQEAKDQACIEIAVKKVVKVELKRPLGDRQAIDGAKQ
jgi:hypothetical protein